MISRLAPALPEDSQSLTSRGEMPRADLTREGGDPCKLPSYGAAIKETPHHEQLRKPEPGVTARQGQFAHANQGSAGHPAPQHRNPSRARVDKHTLPLALLTAANRDGSRSGGAPAPLTAARPDSFLSP